MVDSIFLVKNGDREEELRIDFGEIFVLFAGLANTWRLAIGSLFNFFLNKKKEKFKKSKIQT